MPIRRFLDGQPFDAETIRLMGLAFEMALASFRPIPDYADPIREVIARKIIELAKEGERDPERLCDGALKLRAPCGQRPQSSSASRLTAGAPVGRQAGAVARTSCLLMMPFGGNQPREQTSTAWRVGCCGREKPRRSGAERWCS
jgi:hypothetical protein